ncbi:helix-turn-helix transcriptional regulator [Herbiconiux flava]|uniref:helix-turn-helix transcriptional regulator n=1 Tax=Herbiconiux flava TaxID=881268 RepID=UPI0015CA61EC|nr:transcriptional regulator [Herbiconiux flava]
MTHRVSPHSFGLAVRQARMARGLTQDELAAASSLSRTYVSALETGKRNPTLDTQDRVAAAFNMPLSEIIRHAEDIE